MAYFRGLMSEVERTELVTDELYTLDVQFITDDDKYFPFEVSYFSAGPRHGCSPSYIAFSSSRGDSARNVWKTPTHTPHTLQ